MSDTMARESAQASVTPQHYIDGSNVPEWGTASDGCRVRIVRDVVFDSDFAAWTAEACQHPKQITGKTVNSIGADCYKRYCTTCGIATTQFLPHRTIEGTTITVVDEDRRQKLIDKYNRYRRDALDEIANAAADRSQAPRRQEYAEYLNTPRWRQIRSAVMDRCDGVCEGCRSHSACEVHHLSYKHVGNEFLFELVALCGDCHTRWHDAP